MSQTINCSSCGAANQLPEGKNSMFCAFCGSPIQTDINIANIDKVSSIKVKPEISKRKTEKNSVSYYDPASRNGFNYREGETVTDKGGKLSLVNRNINSIDELTDWFSDNELSEVKILDLSKNKIKNFNELERFNSLEEINMQNNEIESINILSNIIFKIRKIDLSNNKINTLNGLSNFHLNNTEGECEINLSNNNFVYFDDFPCYIDRSGITINLSNNKNLIGFSENVINKIANIPINRIKLILKGCDNFDFRTINDFINSVKYLRFWIIADENKNLPQNLLDIGFVQYSNSWEYPTRTPISKSSNKQKKSGCFIATATMGSYEHPTVMDLRYFRDTWILEKIWGESFVEWYYNYGYIVAKFIEKNFVLKKISYLLIVKPLHLFSKLIIKKHI